MKALRKVTTMKRSKRGTGCVYQRGRVWWLKYFKDGEPQFESSHSDNRKDANALLKIRTGEIAAGQFMGLRAERVVMAELFVDVVDDYKLRKRASIDDVETRIKLHLGPAFGRTRAVEVSTADMNRYITRRRDAGAEDATINRELAVLRRAFSLGASCDPAKVLRLVKVPRLDEDNVRSGFLEHEQYVALRNELPDHARLMLVVGYHTGVRRGELQKIIWPQVDFVAGEIRLEGRQTKNKRPRTLPIYGEMRQWLEMAKAQRDQLWPACEWVFSRNGNKIGDLRKVWNPACERIGVPGLLFHDLRRSAVRNMERAGIPRKTAMEISGHKTEAIYRRYDIISSQDVRNAGVKLENYLNAQQQSAENRPNAARKVN